jgi:hypothetical protein
VRGYFSSDSAVLAQSIDIVFTLNELLLKDEEGVVAKENIKPLFAILRQSNKSFSKLNSIIRSFDNQKLDFIQAGKNVKNELDAFKEGVKRIISAPGLTSDTKLDLVKFVADIQSSFGILKGYNGKTIEAFLSVKKLMLGGEAKFLTREELFTTLDKLPNLGKVFFSIFKGERSSTSIEGNDYVLRLRESLQTIEGQFHTHLRDDEIIDNNALNNLIEFFAAEGSVGRYQKILSIFRKYLLNEGRVKSFLNFKDVKNSFTFAKVLLDSTTFYKKYKALTKDKSSWTQDNWNSKRSEFLDAVKVLKGEAKEILAASNDLPRKYYYSKFLTELSDVINDLPLSKEMVSIISSAKVLFFGGRDDILNTSELVSIVNKLDVFAGSVFDLVLSNKDTHQDGALADIYLSTIDTLEQDFHGHRRETPILDNETLDNILTLIVKNDGDLEKYKRTTNAFRRYLLNDGRDSDELSFKDIRNSLAYIKVYLDLEDFYQRYKDLVKDKDKWTVKEWSSKKALFLSDFLVVGVDLEKTLTANSELPRRIYWLDFINTIASDFPDLSVDENTAKIISTLKVLLVGGEKEFISTYQIFEVIDNLESIGSSGFDLLFANDKNHNDLDLKRTRYKAILGLKSALSKNSYAVVGDISELLDIAAGYLKDEGILNFEPAIVALGAKLIDLRGNEITVDTVRKVLDYAEEFMGITYFMSLSSKVYASPLSYDKTFEDKLTRLTPRSDERFKDFTKDKFKAYDKLFKNIVFNYRIFKNKKGIQVYSDKYERTSEGITELAVMRYGIEELMKVYGSRSSVSNRYSMSSAQINEAMQDVKSILVYLGMWSKKPETFARNVMLLSDLFQGQSNGSSSVDADEGTEFISLVFSASKITGLFEKQLKKVCKARTSRGVYGYTTSCFRKHFFNILMNKTRMSSYLKKFNRYYQKEKKDNPAELNKLLISVEGFARENGPAYPVAKRDITMIIGAILNIESIFVRYDLGKSPNNVLSNEELTRAFPTYEKALIKIGKIPSNREDYALPVFMWVIGKGSIPDVDKDQVALFTYNKWGRYKNVTAKRLNIGQLLYNMVQAANSGAL